MSHNKLFGIDSRGVRTELVASVSHPEKDTIVLKWIEGHDATIFKLNGETLIAVGDGIETFTFKIELQPGEEIVSVERDDTVREIKVVTRVG